jgi:hypothetical protein
MPNDPPKVGDQAGALLAAIPQGLRNELISAFKRIVVNYREGRWEPAELNGGKFSEVVYTILRGHIDGTYPRKATKPSNFVDACRRLEQDGATNQVPRSLSIQIPRMLVALYEIRNNRGVGHVGGDVDPNHMDAVAVLFMAKWVMAELVRMFHTVDTAEASAIVDALVERESLLVWEVAGKKRVLDPKMTLKDKTLTLLYGAEAAVLETDLVSWVESSNPSAYRRDILRAAHRAKLLEYDQESGEVRISPLGVKYVEKRILVRR